MASYEVITTKISDPNLGLATLQGYFQGKWVTFSVTLAPPPLPATGTMLAYTSSIRAKLEQMLTLSAVPRGGNVKIRWTGLSGMTGIYFLPQ